MDFERIIIFAVLMWITSLVIGIVLFRSAYKDKDERTFLLAEAFVWLAMFIVLPIVLSVKNGFLTIAIMLSGFGIFLLLLARQTAVRTKKCNFEIQAKCIGYREMVRSKGQRNYAPQFAYRYQGTDYNEYSIRTYSRQDLDKMFQLHKQYAIFINPNHPQKCIDKHKRTDGGVILVYVWGAMLILLGIVCFVYAI
jgi:Ca2+/Na+ antiporter